MVFLVWWCRSDIAAASAAALNKTIVSVLNTPTANAPIMALVNASDLSFMVFMPSVRASVQSVLWTDGLFLVCLAKIAVGDMSLFDYPLGNAIT